MKRKLHTPIRARSQSYSSSDCPNLCKGALSHSNSGVDSSLLVRGGGYHVFYAEHYNIVREGIVIYGDINKLQINKKIDYAKSVKYWLEQADKNISKFKSEIKHKQPSWGMYSYECIGDMLRAVMLAKHIQIQFTRNIVEYARALNLPDIDKIIKFADWYTSCRLQKNYQDTTLLNKPKLQN